MKNMLNQVDSGRQRLIVARDLEGEDINHSANQWIVETIRGSTGNRIEPHHIGARGN
jgi:hypothetical protein